jgi:hypothetical protein
MCRRFFVPPSSSELNLHPYEGYILQLNYRYEGYILRINDLYDGYILRIDSRASR